MTNEYYKVEFWYYRYNSGHGDNGIYRERLLRSRLSDALAFVQMVKDVGDGGWGI
jgi:hypothetical protein